MQANELKKELAALPTLSLAQLREKWAQESNKPIPRISANLLRLALAWELQAKVHGGLSTETERILDQLGRGKANARNVQRPRRLTREWNGAIYVVNMNDDGAIQWNGQRWNSLSHVARAITGTRWSGPAFFGLTAGKSA